MRTVIRREKEREREIKRATERERERERGEAEERKREPKEEGEREILSSHACIFRVSWSRSVCFSIIARPPRVSLPKVEEEEEGKVLSIVAVKTKLRCKFLFFFYF